MKLVLTGASGCLGAAVLAAWLKAPDAEVVVAGRAAPPVAAGVRPAGPARPVHPVHFVRWDVRQDAPAELAEAARGAAALVHLAAGPGVWFAAREPLQDLDVGVGGALRALALAARAQVGAVVFASTVLVYADPWDADEHAAVEPASVYAAGKLAAEHYLRVLAPGAGVRVAVLRLSWCYGAAMRRGPVADVLRWVRAPDEPLRLYHDLDSEYDLLAAEDAAAAILAAARTPSWPSGPVNVGAGEAVRLGDVVGAAQGVVGRAPTLQIEAREKVRARILAPIAAAHGWKPAVTWREGLGALFRGARNT